MRCPTAHLFEVVDDISEEVEATSVNSLSSSNFQYMKGNAYYSKIRDLMLWLK